MGYWFILVFLDSGVPNNIALYAYEEQRCLTVMDEHLTRIDSNPRMYVEVLYANCLQGSAPRTR
jgi:hypothetical protein